MAEEPIQIVIDPGGNAEPTNSIYVWVAVHGPGDESIMAVNGMPLMAAKYATARRMRGRVAQALQPTRKTAKLIRFDAVAVLEEVG